MTETVTVVFGGPSPEHDISILTGLLCERVLVKSGVDVQCLYWDRGGRWHLVAPHTEARDYLSGAPAKATKLELRLGAGSGDGFVRKPGLRGSQLELGAVLTCFHGGFGEGGGAQALFELLGVPATGGTVAAAALGLDKLAFGSLMADAGIPSLPRQFLGPEARPSFDGPYIVKPRFGGSSIGIEVVDDYETAVALRASSLHLRAGAVVEPYRKDLFDLNISFKTYPDFEVSSLERPLRPGDGAIYSFQNKYIHDSGLISAPREVPAKNVSESTAKMARNLSRRVAELTGLTGIVRVDFLCDGENLYVNEVNSIPGSMALYLWPDRDPARILLDAIQEARLASRYLSTTSFEEGAALRAAGGIAGKLSGLGQSQGRSS
jgi:D-alanine-D-alanine ligase